MKHLFAFMLLFCGLSVFGQLPETNIEHSYNKRGAYLPQGIAGFADSMYMLMSWKRFNADGSERPGDRGTPVWIHADSLAKAGVFGSGASVGPNEIAFGDSTGAVTSVPGFEFLQLGTNNYIRSAMGIADESLLIGSVSDSAQNKQFRYGTFIGNHNNPWGASSEFTTGIGSSNLFNAKDAGSTFLNTYVGSAIASSEIRNISIQRSAIIGFNVLREPKAFVRSISIGNVNLNAITDSTSFNDCIYLGGGLLSSNADNPRNSINYEIVIGNQLKGRGDSTATIGGTLHLPKYAAGTVTGTVANYAAFDSTGKLIQTTVADGNGIISALPLGSVAINAADNNLNITELGSLSFSTTTGEAVQSRVLAGSFSSIPTGLRRIQGDTAKVEMLGDALILQDSSGKYAAHNFNQAYLFATGGFQTGTLTGVSKRMQLSDATGYKSGAQIGDVDVETAWEADTDSTFTLRSGTWRVEYNLRGRVDLDSASIVNASLQIATTNIPSVSQFYYYGDSAKPIAAKEYCTLSGFTVVSIPAGETRLLSLRVSVAPMSSADYEFDRANIIATRIGKP